MNIKKNIPNFITLLNLFSGCLSIVAAFENNLVWAAYFIGIAAILDFLDGTFARILKAKSETGKQLDSLADIVSFGVAPAIILFQLISHSPDLPVLEIFNINLLPFIAFFIPVFSALRLAKFNIDTRQTESFIGLPTPANAIFIASLPLILIQQFPDYQWVFDTIKSSWFLMALTIILSSLLISNIPLFSLKFKNLKWKDNKNRYIFLGISIAFILIFYFAAIPLIIIVYILISVVANQITHKE